MYSDSNFFQFITCIFIIILTSIQLLQGCNLASSYLGMCNMLMVLFYPVLIYTVGMSIYKTKESKKEYKLTRYIINGITLLILLMILFNNIGSVMKLKFKKKKVFSFDNNGKNGNNGNNNGKNGNNNGNNNGNKNGNNGNNNGKNGKGNK